MNSNGFNWWMLIFAPLLLVILLICFVVLDPIITSAFLTIDKNSASIFMPTLVKLGIGSVAFALTAGLLWNIAKGINQPTEGG